MLNDDYISKLRKRLYAADERDDFLNLLLICERILRLYNDKRIESGFDYVEDMYRVGTVFLNTGRVEKALSILLKADKSSKSLAGADSLRTKIINNLAICYINKNMPDKAYLCFKEALKLKKLISGEAGEDYAELLCNTGSALFDMEDYDKAIYYHFEALNKRKSKNIAFADNLNFLGYDFEAKGEIENAVNYFEQALAIIKSTEGADSNDYMANTYYLACVLEKNEQLEKALKYYETVVEKIKETSRQDHPYYAETLGKMANVYVKLENYQRALMLSLKAMTIVKKAMGENHIYYANSIKSAADIYTKINDYDRAVSLYEEEAALKKKILGDKNDVTIKSFIHLSDVYIKCGDIAKAQDICQSVIKELSYENVMYFDCLLALVRVYAIMENVKLLYCVYDMAKTLRADLSFDDMLNAAFESDSAGNNFSFSFDGGKADDDQISLDISGLDISNEPESEKIDNKKITAHKKSKKALNNEEIYEQENFDNFFENDD